MRFFANLTCHLPLSTQLQIILYGSTQSTIHVTLLWSFISTPCLATGVQLLAEASFAIPHPVEGGVTCSSDDESKTQQHVLACVSPQLAQDIYGSVLLSVPPQCSSG